MKKWIKRRQSKSSRSSFTVVSVQNVRVKDHATTQGEHPVAREVKHQSRQDTAAAAQAAFKEIFSTTRKTPSGPRQPSTKGRSPYVLSWPAESTRIERVNKDVVGNAHVRRVPRNSNAKHTEGLPNVSEISLPGNKSIPVHATPTETAAAKSSLEIRHSAGSDATLDTNAGHRQPSKLTSSVRVKPTQHLSVVGSQPAPQIQMQSSDHGRLLPTTIPIAVAELKLNAQAITSMIAENLKIEDVNCLTTEVGKSEAERQYQADLHLQAESPLEQARSSGTHLSQLPAEGSTSSKPRVHEAPRMHESTISKARPEPANRRHTYTSEAAAENNAPSEVIASVVGRRSICGLKSSPNVEDIAKSMYALSRTMQEIISSNLSISYNGKRAVKLTLKEMQIQMGQLSTNCIQMQYLASQQMSALSADLIQDYLIAPCMERDVVARKSAIDTSPRSRPKSAGNHDSSKTFMRESLLLQSQRQAPARGRKRLSMPDGIVSLSDVPPLAPLSRRYSPSKLRGSRASSLTEPLVEVPMENF